MRPRLPPLLGLTAAVTLLLSGCANLERYGQVADFRLTERSGRTVSLDDLKGKVWVASFVFTRCAGPCPRVSATMARLHERVKDRPEVRLVTFTVDPRHDTPEILSAYARGYGAHPDRWLFLTGEQDDVYRLIVESFKLGVSRNDGPDSKPGYEVDHTTRLALVDAQGQIRGYFDGTDPDQVPRLLTAINTLTWPYRLPAVNATLNGTAAVLLVLGYAAVRWRRLALHKAVMLTALAVSAIFLACYLYYHIVVKQGEPTRFQGQGAARTVYFAVLWSHTVLAVVVVPLALYTTYLGLRDRLTRHVRLARWTLPIWLYASVTGVVVYWMLYQLYPPP